MKRFLVTHNYGMGALYWWIEAPSSDAIIQRYAEVEVVDLNGIDPSRFASTASLSIDDPAPPDLAGLEDQRRVQRGKPGYGALVGRGKVYLKQDYAEEDETYLTECDEAGYRTRQIVQSADGSMERSGPDDWLFNPPEDLWNPDLAPCEISREEFDSLWDRARDGE
ncbi:hypothetical protein [Variovorax sp. PAMC26660]|uniref:hypothetical protein n=1 Tax=Variovorax sp. PAMC26660 TaxID=2762322 RepID=UPI00164DDF6C|nr:hypothetical protein [Variovorax sp. PAMC26660]QNK66673.1 hypothetical protein H7F35_26350 [Variovorax sp. PAMC26660]